MQAKPKHLPTHPLAGRSQLAIGDLRMMLRARFWPDVTQAADLNGEAWAAIFGLIALARVPAGVIPDIEMQNAGRVASRSLRVPIRDRIETIRLSPAVSALLDDWIEKRPKTNANRLFVRSDGIPIKARSFRLSLEHIAHTFGLDETISTAAGACFINAFHAHAASSADDLAALNAYLKSLNANVSTATVVTAAERRLVVDRADPFPNAGRRFCLEDRALPEAKALMATLPDTYEECFEKPAKPEIIPLPDDHPLKRELATTQLSRDNAKRGRQLRGIYLRHRVELAARADDGTLPHGAAAEIFGISHTQYRVMMKKAALGDDVVIAPATRRARARPPLTEDEKERMRRIADLSPEGSMSAEEFGYSRLKKHGAFVFELSRTDKISIDVGAKLLGTDRNTFVRMKLDHAADVFGHWLKPRPGPNETKMWAEFVRARAKERTDDDPATDTDFIRELRRRYDLPISYKVACSAIRNYPKAVSTGPNRVGKKPLGQPTSEERRLLTEIEARAKASTGENVTERIERLKADAPPLFGMVHGRRLEVRQAAAALKICATAVGELFTLYIEDDLDLAWAKWTKKDHCKYRDVFFKRLARDGAERGFAGVLRDICRNERKYIGWHRAKKWVDRYEDEHGAKPPGYPTGYIKRRLERQLSPEEKAHLKKIGSIRWQASPDVDQTRRNVLRDDGALVLTLVDDRKLSCADAARLLNMNLAAFRHFHRDSAVGQAARHLEPPPTGEERLLQEDKFIRAAEGADPDGKYRDFTIRLDPLITLSHGRMRKLWNAVRTARAASLSAPSLVPGQPDLQAQELLHAGVLHAFPAE